MNELACWMNAHNAFVMKGVVDRYPTHSVLDLGPLKRFFWRKDYTAGGVKMSLLHLETRSFARSTRSPPSISESYAHLSCPLLARDAFTAENLELQLDRPARAFVNQKRNLTIDASANEVTLSEIFQWYKDDFKPSVLEYLRRASEENRRALDALKAPKIKYYGYDWSINEPVHDLAPNLPSSGNSPSWNIGTWW